MLALSHLLITLLYIRVQSICYAIIQFGISNNFLQFWIPFNSYKSLGLSTHCARFYFKDFAFLKNGNGSAFQSICLQVLCNWTMQITNIRNLKIQNFKIIKKNVFQRVGSDFDSIRK